MAGRSADAILQELQELPEVPGHITPRTFRRKGSTSANTVGKRSKVASWTLDTVRRIKSGRSNPLPLAIPAYESFTSDNTAGNTEQFTLSHSVVGSPAVEDVIVYVDGTYYGEPDAVDYANDTVDVTDPETGSTVHVWYISDEAATVEITKATPSAKSSSSRELFTAPLNLVHQTKQAQQPEYFEFGDGLEAIVADDMTLNVYVDAPYQVAFEAEGGAATPDNLLLNIPVGKGQGTVEGLAGLIAARMG